MVQSNGTRSESQRFKIDFTGSKKYSGVSPEFRRVSTGGEFAARRAMPTSGARGVWGCGGGQSAGLVSRLPLNQPGGPGARGSASVVGSGVSGLNGRNRTAGGRTRQRRIVGNDAVRGRTGGIAHLEPGQYFAFSSPCQVFSLFLLPCRSCAPPRPTFPCAPPPPSVLISKSRTPVGVLASASAPAALRV